MSDENECTLTWEECAENGGHDGWHGREFNPPELRKDHPFRAAYTSYYYAMFRERLRALQEGSWEP